MKKCLVIIPAYNESGNILNVVNRLKKIKLDSYKLDYIVINDGSTDNTKEILEDNNINFLDLPCNLGIGGAVQTGYKYAFKYNYDYAVQFDGDGQHDENYIEKLLTELGDNDMIIGSRFIEKLSKFQTSFMRRVGIKFLSGLIKICTGKKVYDVTSGFRLVNKKIIKEFSNSYPIDYPEPDSTVRMLLKKYKVTEVAVEMMKREHGKSSITAFKSIHYMIKVSISIIIARLS